MPQQPRIEAVIPYYERFMEALPTLADLAAVPEERLLKLWEGLGYYSRARNLKKCAERVMESCGGELPADFEALKALPGSGPYTAGAVASMAFGLPTPAVDGNVLRVLARFDADARDVSAPQVKRGAQERIGRLLTALRAEHPDEARITGDFNEAVMELGEIVCLPGGRPLCDACPLEGDCLAHASGTEEELPRRAPKKARRVEKRTVLLLLLPEKGGEPDRLRVGIRRRPERGLLAGLYEFPSLEGALTEEELPQALVSGGILRSGDAVLKILPVGEARHVFSHVEWEMTGYAVRLAEEAESPGLFFADREELKRDYPLPAAFRHYSGVLETL